MKNLYVLFFLALISCKPEHKTNFTIVESQKQIQYDSLAISTMMLKPKVLSGEGFFYINNDSVYFFDKIFYTVSIFDKNGNFIKQELGIGRGPGEIHSFNYYVLLNDGNHLFFGASWDFNIYEKNWQKKIKGPFSLDFGNNFYDEEELLTKKPDPNDISMYMYNYSTLTTMYRGFHVNSKNELFIPVCIETPNLNPFASVGNADKYYKSGKVVGVVDIQTGKVTKIFGTRSPVYLQHKYIPNFDFSNMTIKNDSTFISFAPDSLIYVYDPEHEPVYAFGRSGSNMNTSYYTTNNYKEHLRRWQIDCKTYGYYTHLFIDKYEDIIFRTYFKGNEDKYSGLLIYKNHTLIADVKVPERFMVIGKIGNTYYCDGYYYNLEEEKAKIGIYTFKLK